jgi:hypothetical protein
MRPAHDVHSGRLKLNGRILRRSPLSRVVELEALVVGVRGKEALWTALRGAQVSLRGIDLDALVESARGQGRQLDELRLSAASRALAPAHTTAAAEHSRTGATSIQA